MSPRSVRERCAPALIAVVASLAAAIPSGTRAAPLWVSLTLHSEHYTRKQIDQGATGYNRDTLGAGVEWVTTPSRSWLAGWYHNSHHRPSVYAAVAEQPIAVGPFKAGAAVGLVTGYPAGAVVPLLTLVASYDGRRYGANLVVTPPVAHLANGSVSLQVKVMTPYPG